MNPLSAVYGQVARFRRHWYGQHPDRQRQLGCPVVSVGNLVMGGSGKTPVVATIAELLREAGYVPAVLSRGYKRRRTDADVVVVSDGLRVIADVEASGDEPQMLARRLAGVPVVIAADRARAGALARTQLHANVLILDDGFQHLKVARTVNLLLLSAGDLDEQVFPAGRLREPLDAIACADALLVAAGAGDPVTVASRFGVQRAFNVSVGYRSLRRVSPFNEAIADRPARVVTVAAIARPERFVNAVRMLGHAVAEQLTFRDHYWFTATDVQRIEQAARDAGVDAILTTEKDAVRLERLVTAAIPWLFLPIDAHVEPADEFSRWILSRIGPAEQRA